MRDLPAAVERVRQLLDLDADPVAVAEVLREDPALAPLLAARPAAASPARCPARSWRSAPSSASRSRCAARGLAAGLVAAPARRSSGPGTLTHRSRRAAALAALAPESLPMPRARGRALVALAAALERGELASTRRRRLATRAALRALPGIGPWTEDYIVMRALGDPDAFLPTDVGVRRALVALGLDGGPRAAASGPSAGGHGGPTR